MNNSVISFSETDDEDETWKGKRKGKMVIYFHHHPADLVTVLAKRGIKGNRTKGVVIAAVVIVIAAVVIMSDRHYEDHHYRDEHDHRRDREREEQWRLEESRQLKTQQEQRAVEIIKEAERGCADIMRPTGKPKDSRNSFLSHTMADDDEFYDFAAHISQKICNKIEKGRFVDLEKLIKRNKTVASSNENGVELINKEGRSYLIPANNKDAPVIKCFRR